MPPGKSPSLTLCWDLTLSGRKGWSRARELWGELTFLLQSNLFKGCHDRVFKYGDNFAQRGERGREA